MNKYAIIVGGGSGTRMGSSIPKQFLELRSKPILMHSIEAFASHNASISIIVVLPKIYVELWKSLCRKYQFHIKHKIVLGGETRFHSVKNALDTIPDDGVIAVHDGVRPLVSQDIIFQAFKIANEKSSAIVAIKSTDSVRLENIYGSRALNREEIYLIQTPQIFRSDILKKAYEQGFQPIFTDDASVVEANGSPIHLVEGHKENIKITHPFDLSLAELILNERLKRKA